MTIEQMIEERESWKRKIDIEIRELKEKLEKERE